MQTELTPGRRFSLKRSSATVERFSPERLKLLGELETSLHGSRRALLALDLAGIERGTREQVGLVRELQRLPEEAIQMPKMRAQQKSDGPESGSQETGATEQHAWPAEMAEVKRCEEAVLQAARVQAALLARARRKLRILANMLAGTSLNYGCLFAKPNGPAPPTAYGMRDGDI